MIELVDKYISNRLQAIKFKGSSITVYDYMPDREKGHTSYPCIAWERIDVQIDKKRMRPTAERWFPSEDQETIRVPLPVGYEERTGPSSWTVKPYPTPVIITYEIHAIATQKNHADWLLELMYQAFPPCYQFRIGEIDPQYPVVVYDKPMNLDDTSIPLFRTAYLLDVIDFWIDRFDSEKFTPITSIDIDITD